ncbi:hypothetical protein [Caulobacter segnis]|uniref:hypothetical protein n=1 Tax=Caulobacter segnis TaxID=88688 RepID=UPI0026EFE295|nr:hypothetical protein [Caulobacter segnis]
MAQKSEDIEALLNAIEELVSRTYAQAAAETLTASQDKSSEARMEIAAKAAKAGRAVKLFRGNGRRVGRALSALQRTLEADDCADRANTETPMDADAQWNAQRIAELHAEVRERLSKFAGSRELKYLAERDQRGPSGPGGPARGEASNDPLPGGPSGSPA